MSDHLLGPGHGSNLYIIIESEIDGDDIREETFDNRDDAEEYLRLLEAKSYMICVEKDSGGVFKVTIEPHT